MKEQSLTTLLIWLFDDKQGYENLALLADDWYFQTCHYTKHYSTEPKPTQVTEPNPWTDPIHYQLWSQATDNEIDVTEAIKHRPLQKLLIQRKWQSSRMYDSEDRKSASMHLKD